MQNTLSVILLFAFRFERLYFAGSKGKILWSFINPLLLAFAIALVFKEIFKINGQESLLTIFSGYLLWQFISGTIVAGHRIFLDDRSYYKQLTGGRHLYLAGFVIFRCLLALPGFLLLASYCWFFLSFSLFKILAFIIGVTLILIFLTGITYLMATWTVFCPDISHGLETAMVFLLWLTLVFYTIDSIPENWKIIGFINPVSWVMDIWRYSLGLNHYFYPLLSIPVFTGVALSLMVFSLSYYMKHAKEMVKQL